MYKIFTVSILILGVSLFIGCAGFNDQLRQSSLGDLPDIDISEEISNNFEYTIGDFDVLQIKVWQGITKPKRKTNKQALGDSEYLIAKGDTLNIYVWQWAELYRDVIVRPDGRISFPLVGDIIVEGITLTELDEIITELLKEYIRYPEVSIMIIGFGQSSFGTKNIFEDIPGEVIVRPDGRISFPFVGEVMARGMTLRELDDRLTQELSTFIDSPEVYVNLSGIGGKRVIVLGEVTNPGVFKPKDNARLLDVIAMAEGYTDDAALNSVILIRGGLDKPQAKRINLVNIIKKGNLKDNIYIQAEDIIYIPKTFISDLNYALEQLIGPLVSSGSAVTSIKTIRGRTTPDVN
ncbi:MAG: polysaccharide biosynthesis/export family protein [Candidatus Omnitrophica bacterium]|nr:polysaccharide biosynthesis/export family protein [Candidatus Omnitrophota bacterium]